MLELAICDDNIDELKCTVKLLHKIFSEQKINYNITLFTVPNELLADKKKYDIAILDIVMGEQNGIDMGCELKKKCPNIHLIYTTSYEQYVMRAINDAHAYAYLCKPLKADNMRRQIMELIGSFSDNFLEKVFYNVTDSKKRKYAYIKLNLKDVLYFEYIKRQRKIAVVLEDEVYEYDCSFENVVDDFSSYDFAVNCRGNLVNLNHIVKIKGCTVYLDNGVELPLSQRRLGNFRILLNDFLQRNS